MNTTPEKILDVQPAIVRVALPFKEIGQEWDDEIKEKRAHMMRVLFFDPREIYERIHLSDLRVSPFKRTNTLFMDILFPQKIKGHCSCGCGEPLPIGRKRWASTTCQKFVEDVYWILYGSVERGRIRSYMGIYYGGDVWNRVCIRCGEVTGGIECDHIVPVHAGGGLCWLSNYQPLCVPCHKTKTKEDRKLY